MKPRHHLYLDEALTRQLELLAARPGTSKSAIVADALRAFLARRGASEIEDMLKVRLDRISAQLGRIERDGHVLIESLALFVRYMLMVTAPLPDDDVAGRTLGRERFDAFLKQVGRQMAQGRPSLGSERDGEPGQ